MPSFTKNEDRIDVDAFLAEFDAAAKDKGFALHPLHQSVAASRIESENQPTIYMSAGIHGDEPAGPLAALEWLKNGNLGGFNWVMCPLLNPAGMGKNIRENEEGVDLNRRYEDPLSKEVKAHQSFLKALGVTFEAAVCLHEDDDPKGFYLLEVLHDESRLMGRKIIEAVRAEIPPARANHFENLYAENGVVYQSPLSRLAFKDGLPEHFYIYDTHMCDQKSGQKHALVFETPSTLPLERRVRAHLLAINALLSIMKA